MKRQGSFALWLIRTGVTDDDGPFVAELALFCSQVQQGLKLHFKPESDGDLVRLRELMALCPPQYVTLNEESV
eukprot:CAMPEP_0202909178 /NCGR_PEP_ID=MMETSP1392-20130828/48582_1 /ASSEMBLY_ACC=CAM_ASM_000868 /TAXON_ID=225041 /ORGANISM="Chlamydomonas chlamydogama, Strain SAG 11-48b" /LENGTH=72 /DNA_ID=CAMNT_0049598851 /DNA_START=99 /DNA_END=313 /DNA_ORIENTATION=+